MAAFHIFSFCRNVPATNEQNGVVDNRQRESQQPANSIAQWPKSALPTTPFSVEQIVFAYP
jgi:hypothetical protein